MPKCIYHWKISESKPKLFSQYGLDNLHWARSRKYCIVLSSNGQKQSILFLHQKFDCPKMVEMILIRTHLIIKTSPKLPFWFFPSRFPSEASYMCWNFSSKINDFFLAAESWLTRNVESAVSLGMSRCLNSYFFSCTCCKFYVKVSLDSFLLEADLSFLKILSFYLHIGLGFLIDKKWQLSWKCNMKDTALTSPINVWSDGAIILGVSNAEQLPVLFLFLDSSKAKCVNCSIYFFFCQLSISYFSKATGLILQILQTTSLLWTFLPKKGSFWKWFVVCSINVFCAPLREVKAVQLPLFFIFLL